MYVKEISLNNIWLASELNVCSCKRSNKSSLEIRLVQSGNYGNEEQLLYKDFNIILFRFFDRSKLIIPDERI